MLSRAAVALKYAESRLRFKTMETKTQKTYLLIGILLEKPRIKVGSMQRELQKIRTPQMFGSAIAVLKGKALIKNIKGGLILCLEEVMYLKE